MELKAELQIRTLAQHVWADLYHEMGYKNEFRLPRQWERQFGRAAALLESCDRGFQQIRDEIGAVESNYSGYMTEADLSDLEFRIETLLEIMTLDEPGRVKIVHRLIRAYLSHRAVPVDRLETLLVREDAALAAFPPALRDAGVAYCKIRKPGDPDGFFNPRKLDHAQDRAKNFFPGNVHVIRHVFQNCWLEEKSFFQFVIFWNFSAAGNGRALLDGFLNIFKRFLPLFFADDRAELRLVIQGVADLQFLGLLDQRLHKFVVNAFL